MWNIDDFWWVGSPIYGPFEKGEGEIRWEILLKGITEMRQEN